METKSYILPVMHTLRYMRLIVDVSSKPQINSRSLSISIYLFPRIYLSVSFPASVSFPLSLSLCLFLYILPTKPLTWKGLGDFHGQAGVVGSNLPDTLIQKNIYKVRDKSFDQKEKEGERERENQWACLFVRERERKNDREENRERERGKKITNI